MFNLDKTSSLPFFNPDEMDAIFFKDVQKIVKNKDDLESILYSTKIMFEDKEDLINFMKMLIKFGFRDMALNYFEQIIDNINDIELIDELNKILRK